MGNSFNCLPIVDYMGDEHRKWSQVFRSLDSMISWLGDFGEATGSLKPTVPWLLSENSIFTNYLTEL